MENLITLFTWQPFWISVWSAGLRSCCVPRYTSINNWISRICRDIGSVFKYIWSVINCYQALGSGWLARMLRHWRPCWMKAAYVALLPETAGWFLSKSSPVCWHEASSIHIYANLACQLSSLVFKWLFLWVRSVMQEGPRPKTVLEVFCLAGLSEPQWRLHRLFLLRIIHFFDCSQMSDC